MPKMKRLIIIFLCITFVLLSFSACTEKPEPGNKSFGLTFDPDSGTMVKDKKDFYAMGLNYFSLFTSIFDMNWDLKTSFDALEVLKSYDVKVIRFGTLPFYYTAYDKYYFDAQGMYWQKMDELVAKCEELEIGLVPSMFWTYAINDYYDEPLNSVAFDKNSKTMKFIKDYTEKFVKRYAESSAIYMWEFSNERILASDLTIGQINSTWRMRPDSARGSMRTIDDVVTLDGLEAYYSYFAEIIYENDPHHRIIGTGDTGPRNTQRFQYNNSGSMTQNDSRDDHLWVVDKINPVGITALSQHQYSEGTVSPLDKTWKCLNYYDSWEGFFDYLIDRSLELGITCYAGEVGYSLEDNANAHLVTEKDVRECFEAIGAAAFKTKIPLVLFWNYDPLATLPEGMIYGRGSGVEYSWNENMTRGKIALEVIKNTNALFAAL